MESVQQLLKRVSKVGLKPAYLERVLPPWVSDYPPETETGLIELKVLLAKELGLDLNSLGEDQQVSFGSLPTAPRFKRIGRGDAAKLKPAASMFYSLARALVGACANPFEPLPENPDVLRAEITQQTDGGVTLRGLLECLWRHGIPVAHYTHWPDRLSRPAGMAVDVGGRPVIILGSVRKENAWHAFHAAHEAGHVARKHLGRDQMIVDDGDTSLGSDEDAQEKEADAYALRLLAGIDSVKLPDDGGMSQVEREIKALARQQNIDRGHLALRFGVSTGKWPMATSILQHLEPGSDAPVLINQDIASKHLDFEALSEERQSFLRRVLSI